MTCWHTDGFNLALTVQVAIQQVTWTHHFKFGPNKNTDLSEVQSLWAEGVNPLNAKLNPICHLLALLRGHHIFHISRIKVKDAEIHTCLCTQ